MHGVGFRAEGGNPADHQKVTSQVLIGWCNIRASSAIRDIESLANRKLARASRRRQPPSQGSLQSTATSRLPQVRDRFQPEAQRRSIHRRLLISDIVCCIDLSATQHRALVSSPWEKICQRYCERKFPTDIWRNEIRQLEPVSKSLKSYV